jgi:hypothetical protein
MKFDGMMAKFFRVSKMIPIRKNVQDIRKKRANILPLRERLIAVKSKKNETIIEYIPIIFRSI